MSVSLGTRPPSRPRAPAPPDPAAPPAPSCHQRSCFLFVLPLCCFLASPGAALLLRLHPGTGSLPSSLWCWQICPAPFRSKPQVFKGPIPVLEPLLSSPAGPPPRARDSPQTFIQRANSRHFCVCYLCPFAFLGGGASGCSPLAGIEKEAQREGGLKWC